MRNLWHRSRVRSPILQSKVIPAPMFLKTGTDSRRRCTSSRLSTVIMSLGSTPLTPQTIALMLPSTSVAVTSLGSSPSCRAALVRSNRRPPTSKPSMRDEATHSARCKRRVQCLGVGKHGCSGVKPHEGGLSDGNVWGKIAVEDESAFGQIIRQVDQVVAGTAVTPS